MKILKNSENKNLLLNNEISFRPDLGWEDGMQEFEKETLKSIINPNVNFETVRYVHSGYTSTNGIWQNDIWYYFYFANIVGTHTGGLNYELVGLTPQENSKLLRHTDSSFFRLEFYKVPEGQLPNSSNRKLVFTKHLPIPLGEKIYYAPIADEIFVPIFTGSIYRNKENMYLFWFQDGTVLNGTSLSGNTFYVSARYFNTVDGSTITFLNKDLPTAAVVNEELDIYHKLIVNQSDYSYVVYSGNTASRIGGNTITTPIKFYAGAVSDELITISPTPSPSARPPVTPSNTPTPSVTPSPTPSFGYTPAPTPTPTITPTPTQHCLFSWTMDVYPRPSATPTPTPTATVTPTPTQHCLFSWTMNVYPIPSQTPTPTKTPTQTPTQTPTPTITPTPTQHCLFSWTMDVYPVPSQTPTASFNPSPTPTPSNTPTQTPTPTITPTPTQHCLFSWTMNVYPIPSQTPTPTKTPSQTPTQTPTVTPSNSPAPPVVGSISDIVAGGFTINVSGGQGTVYYIVYQDTTSPYTPCSSGTQVASGTMGGSSKVLFDPSTYIPGYYCVKVYDSYTEDYTDSFEMLPYGTIDIYNYSSLTIGGITINGIAVSGASYPIGGGQYTAYTTQLGTYAVVVYISNTVAQDNNLVVTGSNGSPGSPSCETIYGQDPAGYHYFSSVVVNSSAHMTIALNSGTCN